MRRVTFDSTTGAYVDTRATRGFPMGGIGSGGLSVATDGGFGELRLNNNWMCPIRDVRGAFHALWVRRGDVAETVVLSRTSPFSSVRGVRSTTFVGRLPGFAFIKDFLPAKEWTDLTMSLVLQVGKHCRTTGRRDVLDRFWPALVRGMEYLDGIAPRGVPEGGTTYDVWDFPGAFAYTATLYLATLATMADLAATEEPARAATYRARADACARRIDTDLWDARGYFRTSEATDTIFTAALAGDWAARLAGLDPVVDPERALRHLRHAHRVLVAAAGDGALPRAEARVDGTQVAAPMAAGLPPDEEMVYVWQVLSYQAMEQIYVGDVDAGLETIRRVYDRIWNDGHAWSAGLRGNGESVYMTHPVIWAVLNALTGAALDVPARTLHLSPRMAGRCPFFFPSFWAMCEFDPESGRTTVEVLRTFGAPVTVARVQHRVTSGVVRVHETGAVTLATGTRLELVLRA